MLSLDGSGKLYTRLCFSHCYTNKTIAHCDIEYFIWFQNGSVSLILSEFGGRRGTNLILYDSGSYMWYDHPHRILVSSATSIVFQTDRTLRLYGSTGAIPEEIPILGAETRVEFDFLWSGGTVGNSLQNSHMDSMVWDFKYMISHRRGGTSKKKKIAWVLA